MPELPEVEMAKQCVVGNNLGRTLLRLYVLDQKMLEGGTEVDVHHLEGDVLRTVERHGKNLFLVFGRGVLHVHLGMSGSVHWCDEGRHTPYERLRLTFDHGVLVLDDPRRFGRFGAYPSLEEFIERKALGPDALVIEKDAFVARLRTRRGGIKPVLLDQHVVAGVGNLYADEVLFQAGIAPTRTVASLSNEDLGRLWQTVRRVLLASIKVGTDFNSLPRGYMLPERGADRRCPRCGRGLSTMVVGGRTTVLCAHCQI